MGACGLTPTGFFFTYAERLSGEWLTQACGYLTWVIATPQRVTGPVQKALSDWHMQVGSWPGSVPLCSMSPVPWVIDTGMRAPDLSHCPCTACLPGPGWLTQVCGYLTWVSAPVQHVSWALNDWHRYVVTWPGSVPLCSWSQGLWVIDTGMWVPDLVTAPVQHVSRALSDWHRQMGTWLGSLPLCIVQQVSGALGDRHRYVVNLTWVIAPVQLDSGAQSDWHRYVGTWPGSVPLSCWSKGPEWLRQECGYLTWVIASVKHVYRFLSDWGRNVVTWPGSLPLCSMSPGPWVIDRGIWLPEWLTQVCG